MPITIESLSIIIGLIIIIFMIIQAKIKIITVRKKNNKKKAHHKLSGLEVARKILDANDLDTFYILENTRNDRNYYDSSRNVMYLSSTVFNGEDIYSTAIAAYETGYAIQSKNSSRLLSIHDIFLPIMNIILYLGYIMLIFTIITRSWTDIKTTVIIWGFVLFFHLITLPLEYNCVHIANEQLLKYHLVSNNEKDDIEAILNDYTNNYIASMIDNIINVIKDLIGSKNNESK